MESSEQPPSFDFKEFTYAYWDIAVGLLTAIAAYCTHLNSMPLLTTILAAVSIASLSVTISEIAEILAEKFGEPYGSFVLTFSAVTVEIILLFMVLKGGGSESIHAIETVKSGIVSAIIVDMNVLLGLSVFIGGLVFKEQEHNEDTSSTYTTILFVSALALLVPSVLQFSNPDALKKASIIISIMLVFYYMIIYVFQTKTHRDFFKPTARSRILRLKKKRNEEEEEEEENYIFDKLPNLLNLFFMFILILIVGFTAEIFAKDGMPVFKDLGISTGLAGLIIAIISATPEIFTSIKAAKNDQIQRVINIAMGASTVSILLTVPILMGLAYINGINFTLNFNSLQIGALIFTIILAWKTTENGETNYIEGISHLMLFFSFAIIASFY